MKQLIPPSSGSIAGTTYSRNRYGQYIRTRAIPVNPSTAFQTQARGRLSQLSAQWRVLTIQAREAWIASAAEVVRTDSLGQSYSPTGQQWFVGVNSNNLAVGLPVALTPPVVATPGTPTIAAVTLSAAVMSVTPSAAGSTGYCQVWASPPLSVGVSFNKDFRLMTSVSHITSVAIIFTNPYQNRFGAPPVGTGIIVRCNFIALGQAGGSVEIAGTVA